MNETETPRSEKAANESISEVYRTSQQLERELAQSIEANAGLYKACDALESQLNEATKQRDELAVSLRIIERDDVLGWAGDLASKALATLPP